MGKPKVVRNTSGEVDFDELNKPTVLRKKAAGDGFGSEAFDDDMLDIPAFLRRQAD